MEIYQDWTSFKSTMTTKLLSLQYYDDGQFYKIWAVEGGVIYKCDIYKESPESTEQSDFETNYKDEANQPVSPLDEYGKLFVRAESRPLDMTTYFTSNGDSESNIGDGQRLEFNFNNTDDDVSSSGSETKQKKIEFTFIDKVRIKEGTIYWQNMPFGSNISLSISVPNNGYYKKNDGSIVQNTTGSSLVIEQFVNKSPMMGDCPMGDELNTEVSSGEIPAGMIFSVIVTVPDSVGFSDDVRGAIQLELYRERTVILE